MTEIEIVTEHGAERTVQRVRVGIESGNVLLEVDQIVERTACKEPTVDLVHVVLTPDQAEALGFVLDIPETGRLETEGQP